MDVLGASLRNTPRTIVVSLASHHKLALTQLRKVLDNADLDYGELALTC